MVSESVKQSWNDVVVPEYNVVEETNQSVKKKKSEENVTIKKKSKEKM